jgi:hypothetical protein
MHHTFAFLLLSEGKIIKNTERKKRQNLFSNKLNSKKNTSFYADTALPAAFPLKQMMREPFEEVFHCLELAAVAVLAAAVVLVVLVELFYYVPRTAQDFSILLLGD